MILRGLLILLLAIFSVTAKAGVQAGIPQAESAALSALFTSTNGNNWTNNSGWLVPGDECFDFGIVCNESFTSVISISLPNNNLDGSLPSQLGDLSNLEFLSLSGNNLSGSIPAALGNLSQLKTLLDLSNNNLGGNIPGTLGNLSQLEELRLQGNSLNGPIPPDLGKLSSLDILLLDDNQLDGTIPPELGDLNNLSKIIGLQGNRLAGPIPPQLTGLTQLPDNDETFGLFLDFNKLFLDEPVDETLKAFLDAKAPGWENFQTVAPTNIKISQDGDQITVSWTPIAYQQDAGRYEVLSSTLPDTNPLNRTSRGSTNSKRDSQLTFTGDGTHFISVRTITDAGNSNQSTLTSDLSDEVNTQCAEPLQSMQISGSAGIGLGDPFGESGEPGAEGGFMTMCYDPVNDCYIVPGNNGLQAGLTFEMQQQSGSLGATAIDACGSQQSTRPDKEFQVGLSSNVPAKQGGDVFFNCLNVVISNSSDTPDSSGGCLVDSTGNGSFDAVDIEIPETSLEMRMSLPFFPDANNPTHIYFPAILGFDTPPNKAYVGVYVPLDKDGNITVKNGTTGQTMGTISVVGGVNVTENEIFSNGFETVNHVLQWIYDLWN